MAQSSFGSPGLLSAGVSHAGERDEDRSYARDLNLDQIVAAIAGDREEAAEDERHRRPDRPALRAERQPNGRRDYRLAVKDPLPTSFGEDLYYRLGGWLEETAPCP